MDSNGGRKGNGNRWSIEENIKRKSGNELLRRKHKHERKKNMHKYYVNEKEKNLTGKLNMVKLNE